MKPAWLLSRTIAVLVAASLSAYCNSPTAPSGSDVRASSWVVEPSHLQLTVGDTGEIRVVLFKGSDTLDIRSPHRGEIVSDLDGDAYAFARVRVDYITTNIRTYRIEALSPGTVYLTFSYGEYGHCQDLPECLIRDWTNYLPGLTATIEVQ
jgi:hypothetical protein